jgi:tRNA A-37 threonylcarbamoyl transferase component Bud32
MVVIERLPGKPVKTYLFQKEHFKTTVFDDITGAVERLQEHDFVHGDLRAMNIMIDPQGEHAKLLDFDWAGKSRTARYPLTIDAEQLRDEWHPDASVEAEALMALWKPIMTHSYFIMS